MALDYLLKQEWSMGNGQCPECCGVPESWHGHSLYTTSDEIGHELDCELAESIKDLGGNPLMIGDYKSDKVYESYWNDNGILAMREVESK